MTLVMSTLQKYVISNVRYVAVICYFLDVSGGYLHPGCSSGELL